MRLVAEEYIYILTDMNGGYLLKKCLKGIFLKVLHFHVLYADSNHQDTEVYGRRNILDR